MILVVDFNILVLGAGQWPLQPPSTTFNLPEDVSDFLVSFIQEANNGILCLGCQNIWSIPKVLPKQAFWSQAQLALPIMQGWAQDKLS